MNLKLNVVRFENEDVIATSGLCAHIDAFGSYYGHIYVYSLTELSIEYEYYEGELYYQSDGYRPDWNPTYDNVTSTGWYYYDSSGKYVKCLDQSNAAHPVHTNS